MRQKSWEILLLLLPIIKKMWLHNYKPDRSMFDINISWHFTDKEKQSYITNSINFLFSSNNLGR